MLAKRQIARRIPAKKNRTSGRIVKVKYAALTLSVIAFVTAASYLAYEGMKAFFPVERVVFSGNRHLTDEELLELGNLHHRGNLLTLSGRTLFQEITRSPWIKSVSIRKELPDTLYIMVRETEPFALLDMKAHLFLVDENGHMLEELKNSAIPFLPIISGNPYGRSEVFSEAVLLAKAVKKSGLLSEKDHIEIIAHTLNEIALNLDGIVVKVGTGEYEEKLVRLMELEEEIESREIPVDYIDLRFENRVIVKPVNEVVKK